MSDAWPLVSLREVLTPISRPEPVDSQTTYHILGAHWYAGGLYIKDTKTGALIQADKVYRVRQGDFVYNRLFAWKGSFAVATAENDGCYVSNEFPCFTVNEQRADGQYLWRYFSQQSVWDEALGESTGGTPTSRNRLKEEKLLSMEVPLPPVCEQRRIVARIEELAAKIEEARGLRRQATDETSRLIASLVSNLDIDEQHWTSVQAAVCNKKGAVRSGPFGSQLHHDEFVEAGVAAIGTRDVQVNRFDLKSGWYVTHEKFEQFRRYQVFSQDVLTTIVGASIGRFCVVPEDIPLAFTTKHIMALTLNRAVVEPKFVTYLLNYHPRCRRSIFSQCEGSAQPSLNASKVLATALAIPSLHEQRRILTELEAVQVKVDSLKQLQAETATELDALLPSVLDKAFSGEL